MHGSIGTSAAIAQLGDDGVTTIHTHSQSVFETGEAIAMMLGVPSITTLTGAGAAVNAIKTLHTESLSVRALQEYHAETATGKT